MTTSPTGARRTGPAGLYAPLDWALLRAPLLPATAMPTGAEPRVRAALAVASGDLLAALDRTPGSDRRAARRDDRLLRYLIRMRTRSTPFGLFAGVALVGWGPRSDVALSGDAPRTRTRPDMEWLLGLVETLERDEEIRPSLGLRADPTAVVHGGRVFRTDADGREVSVRATAPVRHVLELARSAVPRATVVDELAERSGAGRERVDQLVDQLALQGFLTSDLRPPLTGGDPGAYVLGRLRAIPAATKVADALAEVLALLEDWDRLPLEARADRSSGVLRPLHDLHPPPPSGALLQTDLAWTLERATLSRAVGHHAAQAAELLVRLNPHPGAPPHLEAYRRAFVERYGQDREVPLLELLDPHLGLGSPAPAGPTPPTDRDRLLARLALDCARDGRTVVEIDDRMLRELATWTPGPDTAPRSLDLMVLLVAPSLAAIDAGEFQLVVGPNPGADAAGRGLGRFADLLGDPGRAALQRAVDADAALTPGRLLVEVVHAPQRWRSANVAVRPAVHEHEVVIGVPPGVPEREVVPVDELVVGTDGQRLVVRWPSAGTEVVAVQSHMLNRALAPPAARLLLDLATDGRCGFGGFDWGSVAAAYPFLPRVQRGRLVLAPARWWLRAPDPTARPDDLLDAWGARWGVPREVYLSTGDHRLLLDLDDARHRDIVLDELRRAGAVQLHEALPGLGSAWLPGPDGARVAELVVPLALREKAAAPPAVGARRGSEAGAGAGAGAGTVGPGDRLRLPGSDWLYLKLYGPAAFQDDLVTGPLLELARTVTRAGLVDRWFFVRYADPDPHLRVRFHGEPTNLLGPLLRAACAWADRLVADGTCSRFAVDTYEREVERYGGAAGIDAAEMLFCADSVVVATVLPMLRDDVLPFDALTLAMLSVDDLLDGLGLHPARRTALYGEAAPLTREGGAEYRRRKADLRRLLGAQRAPDVAGLGALFALRRATGVRVDSLRVARSHVHMHLNRLLADGVAEQTVLELLRRTRAGLDRSTDPDPGTSTGAEVP